MFENFNLHDNLVLIGVLALVVIIALWYIFLRKRANPEEESQNK
jgi:hypothetical protein